jgi:hypothetical protein
MESVGDLIIIVNDVLPFLANVYLYNQKIDSTQNNTSDHLNI